MTRYTLTHLSDRVLLRDLTDLVARDRATTAELLAHLAEVDARRLYLPAGYPSLFAWCVGVLGFSEDSAAKRIQAARAARRFPALFEAVADGRLHLSAVTLLAPHLAPESAGELIAAATRRSKTDIEHLLAERFPRPDLPTLLRPVGTAAARAEHAPGHVPNSPNAPALALAGGPGVTPQATPARECAAQHAPGHVGMTRTEHSTAPVGPRPRLSPLSPDRYALQVTLARATHDKLRHAQALLGHAVPSGDVAEVLDRALDALIVTLERRKCAAAARPRAARPRAGGPPRSADPRRIPAAVRRAVWERDRGRCTFVGENGHRCEARARLEYDHVEPAARGGQASVMNLRLRCRAHNQYEARRALGAGLVERRRDEAMRARAERRQAMHAMEKRRARGAQGETSAATARAAPPS